MKLVDILARELKVWPEGVSAIEQDLRGSCLYQSRGPAISAYVESMADDADTAVVTRAQWQAAVDALKDEKDPAWVGVGLPPVDLPCQWHSDSQTGWQEVIVLAYSGESAWIQPKGKPSIIVGNPANFLPIRTSEQIAADERSKAIEQMVYGAVGCERGGQNTKAFLICGLLYDAGYRKTSTTDN